MNRKCIGYVNLGLLDLIPFKYKLVVGKQGHETIKAINMFDW